MLYNYFLWFNEYDGLWYAIHRNSQTAFFSGDRKNSEFITSKSISKLLKQLQK